MAGKYLAPKHLSSCLLSPRQFPSVRAPHKELRVLLVRELSEARDSESAADIKSAPGPAEKHQNYLTKGVYAIGYIAKIFFRVLMMGIVSMFHLSAAA